MHTEPDKTTIASYLQGALSSQDHETVELWLDAQPTATVDRMLEEASAQLPPFSLPAEELQEQSIDIDMNTSPNHYFTPELQANRYHYIRDLGAGGMGVVELVQDRVLSREVAIKRSRPRGFDEPVARLRHRQQLFQREAEIVGRLEHPGIIPLHDIGVDRFGNPAMIMKPLQGVDFEAWRRQSIDTHGAIDLVAGLRIIISVAQAIAYAHDHGIIHRDIKVDNIVIGDHGEVTVIDWGIAIDTRIDTSTSTVASTGGAYGTPSWMAPEQALGATADPRMDVWALGGLLLFLCTGSDPRPDIASAASIDAEMIARPLVLGGRRLDGIPKGLQAVIRHCLCDNPLGRYRHGAEVAAELQRWVREGVTKAQRPGMFLRMKALVRRHPLASAITLTCMIAAGVVGGIERVHHYNDQYSIQQTVTQVLARTNMSNMQEVMTTQRQMKVLSAQYGALPFLVTASARLNDAHTLLTHIYATQETERALDGLDQHFRQTGPWRTELADRKQVLTQAGISLAGREADIVAALRAHSLSKRLLANVAHMQVAALIHDKGHAQHQHSEHEAIGILIADTHIGSSWQALGDILHRAKFSAHEVILQDTNGLDRARSIMDRALADTQVGDVLLALCQPNDRLLFYSHSRILAAPDAFWPRIILARDAIVHNDLRNARLHALVALGREGDSLWPKLMLAYIELFSNNLVDAQMWVGKILTTYPDHLETRVLRAALLLESGNATAAQNDIDDIAAWDHFHAHEQYGGGHPMDMVIAILQKKQIRLHEKDAHTPSSK